MSASHRLLLGAVVLTLLAAVIGGWIGVRYGLQDARSQPTLDDLLHHKLDLTVDQKDQIASLEGDFSKRRSALEAEMRVANRELAAALLKDPVYGAAAKAAVDHFHAVAATLQEQTIRHVLAMRSVLAPEQVRKFDATLSEALNSGEP